MFKEIESSSFEEVGISSLFNQPCLRLYGRQVEEEARVDLELGVALVERATGDAMQSLERGRSRSPAP